MSSHAAWAVRLATASPMSIFVPLRHCAQKWKKLLESHLSVTCEGRADEPWDGDEGKVMHDEGCAFHQMSLPAAVKQRDTAMQKYSRACQGPLTSLIHSHGAFGELWIFMMMLIYWVAIGARTANKLSPPCLKGNALPILKTLSCDPKLRLQVGDANPIVQPPQGGLHLEGPR